MPLLHAIVLGIVQGLSEFLPISSSGHLILVPELFGWDELVNDPALNKTFDVALHVGTLVAALWYFRADVARYARAAWTSIGARSVTTVDQRLAWLLALSAVPAALTGALLEGVIDDHLGDPVVIGINLIVFGIVLHLADRALGARSLQSVGRRDAVLMGGAQALALAPGVSRSGVTISAGRALGLAREDAARLSFLMSLPVITGAALYKGAGMIADGGIPAGFRAAFLWGIVSSMVSGFLAITVLLRLLRTRSFRPFVLYRVVVGIAVVVVFATGLR